MTNQPYASYLVRIWLEDSEEVPENEWHLEVESVQTGRRWRLYCLPDLLDFIQAQMADHALDFSESDQDG